MKCFYCNNEATHKSRVIVDIEPGDDGQLHSVWSEEDLCDDCLDYINGQEGGDNAMAKASQQHREFAGATGQDRSTGETYSRETRY